MSLTQSHTLIAGSGGAEFNVAVHLSRLDVPVRFAGRVGDDPLGHRLLRTLEEEGVDASSLTFDPMLPTGLYLKDRGTSGSTAYYYRRGSAGSVIDRLDSRSLEGVSHLHVTGVTAALSGESRSFVEQLLARRRSFVASFDVNYRERLWAPSEAAPVLESLVRSADVAFVGMDEAEVLWACESPDAVRRLFPEPSELIVKHGGRPATAYLSRAAGVVEPALEMEIVEPVGAGDAFAAGYLASRRTGHDVAAALRVGHSLAFGVYMDRTDIGPVPDPRVLASARSGDGWPESIRSIS